MCYRHLYVYLKKDTGSDTLKVFIDDVPHIELDMELVYAKTWFNPKIYQFDDQEEKQQAIIGPSQESIEIT